MNMEMGFVAKGRLPVLQGFDLGSETFARTVNEKLLLHGAVLARGTPLESPDHLEEVAGNVFGAEKLMEYEGERASPRTAISSRAYTATEYSSTAEIFPHNEMSNRTTWPRTLTFYCDEPANEGGQTPLRDMREDEFAQKGITYIRNYGGRFGVSLEYGFGTEDKAEIEDYCRTNELNYKWKSDTQLATWFTRPAFAHHPATKEELWFNYATFYALSTTDPKFKKFLERIPLEERPFAVRYGDGSAIAPETIEICRQAYQRNQMRFEWVKGDLLFVDNMLAAHGRDPFDGSRSHWLVMSEETDADGFVANANSA